MKSSLIITFLLIFGNFFLVNSQSDSCNSILNLTGVIPFETSSLQCHSVWNSQGYILRYQNTGTNLWSFVLSTPNPNSYIAIGFSPNGKMAGSSAVVGWIPASGTGIVKQYFLGAPNANQVFPDEGNLQLVNKSMAIISQSSRLFLAFQLNAVQPSSRVIYSVGPENWYPSSNFRLIQHRDDVSTFLNYVTGQTTVSKTYSKLRKAHGVFNMLGWGILILIGAIVARYFRQWDPLWFYSHVSIQMLGFSLGLIGIILGFILNDRIDASVDRHKTIGLFILVLGSLQVMAFLARPKKESKVRKYWNWYHIAVGCILMVLAISNVFYGIHLGGEGTDWNAGYGVTIAILFLVAIGLEVRMWMTK